ncbi:tyrosine-type recombinase/integrase [Streptomyces sp. NPDC007095]|uniref:tyrosine-type recombinase/integrase n=1 Tax=Streptomyces sp. NPDC007095 TaxID=3154482 RepID=UPI0033C31E0D
MREGEIDFTPILQPWLREVAMHWARTTLPGSSALRDRLLACTIASQALAIRDVGADPAALGFADMTAVVNEFRVALRRDGTPRSNDSRARLLKLFTEILEFGRMEGVLGDLSPRFVFHPNEHRIKRAKSDEDDIGKALPESVVAQLDERLDLIGIGTTYGNMSTDCIQAMFRTVYVLLRDTGRRPNEIGALALSCLEYDAGEYQLIWDNTKAGRLRRRLPLDRETVTAIREWTSVRERLDLPSRALPFLFPAITDNGATGHLTTANIGGAIRTWADSIPEIHSEELGPDGTPLPFDRSLIYPYAFRHSFCQRYADAGMPQHVLQDLMDHKSADITAAYYKVSIKMKREAINTIKSLTTDCFGKSAPMGSSTAYEMRSVAVAFGNCIEPTNVRAGGKACPIRFQCAGCGSYRPDPSYLPAVEEHIRALKADRELAAAMGAADFVIRNLNDQITAFQGVSESQKEKLASMPDEMRDEVEEASKVLRKLRAGASKSAVSLGMPGFGPPEVVA